MKKMENQTYQRRGIRRCPVCQAAMGELARLADNESIMIWYKCSDSNCSGRWMQNESYESHEQVLNV